LNLQEELFNTYQKDLKRRQFLKIGGLSLGAMALAGLSGCDTDLSTNDYQLDLSKPMLPRASHFAPKAKTVIFLHMAGAPSQLELFEYKKELHKLHGLDCPPSLLEGKRFAFIEGVPKMLGPQFDFQQYGETGSFVSDRLPNFSKVVDEVTFLRAVHTDEFNHAPAQLFMHTGSPRMGRPSMGAWVTYGLGSENENLPGFVVLVSGQSAPSAGKSVWGSGFLPSVFQGVQCRSQGDPVLYVSNPDGMPSDVRKASIEAINKINQSHYEQVKDPEIITRISQYEMAFRMQTSVPEVMNIKEEPEYIHELYGTEPGKTSFANNCLLARRLAERGVRFVQLFHRGWDSHGSNQFEALGIGFVERCKEIDKAMTALVLDLKQRGLLEETLIVWGGEFGRTPMLENRGGVSNPFAGRDHHKEAFTMWAAGGGLKQGFSFGETDEIGYSGIKDRIHVHDLQATILHLLGMNHERLTYPFQGRDFRLTDVHGHVGKDIIA